MLRRFWRIETFVGWPLRSGEDGSTVKKAKPDRRSPGRPRRFLRTFLKTVGWLVLLGGVGTGVPYLQARTALGEKPDGNRLARMMASPQWKDGGFQNPEALDDQIGGALRELIDASDHVTPAAPMSVVEVDHAFFEAQPPSGLRVTWLGHSTALIEIDGHIVLTDPVWGPRASPLPWLGPKRWYDPPLPFEDLPRLDAVVISHDHYDHLDHPTVVALADSEVPFVVPLGVGAHLERWGVGPERIVELDWWDRYSIRDLEIVMTPARHASGRHMFDGNRTLWAGYAFVGTDHRVFFSGDTGMFPGIVEIGDRLGPFDLTMIEIGTYAQSWADWHMGPEQAVEAHSLVRGHAFLPIHWGLFNLSTHGWTEPIERALVAAESKGVVLLAPKPGETIDIGKAGVPRSENRADPATGVQRWWPDLPWRTATEYPLVSSQLDDPLHSGVESDVPKW